MTTTSPFVTSFSLKLLLVLLVVGIGHYLIFELNYIHINPHLWALSYFINFVLAFLAIMLIYKFRISHTPILGYIFLVTSLIKLFSFPLFVQPVLYLHCPNKTHAFFLFFVPYFTALCAEVWLLITLLNDQ